MKIQNMVVIQQQNMMCKCITWVLLICKYVSFPNANTQIQIHKYTETLKCKYRNTNKPNQTKPN